MTPDPIPGGDDPVVEETPAPETTEVVETSPTTEEVVEEIADAPWATELRERFQDPETFKAVDEYMRATVQPYITDLETKSKTNREANHLWDSFHEDPVKTYEGVTNDIFGPAEAERIMKLVRGEDITDELDTDPDPDSDNPTAGDDDGTISMEKLPPEIREFVEEGISAREKAQYDAMLADVETELTNPENPDGPVKFDKEMFEHHIVLRDGNLDEAKASYRDFVGKASNTFGIDIEGLKNLGKDKPADEAPPTINTNTAAGSVTPPQEPDYKGDVSKAIDDMFSDTPPPPVPS